MDLTRIVNVQIALQTRGIEQLSFSDFMVVAALPDMTVPSDVITGPDDLLENAAIFGELTPLSPVYIAAVKAFAQTPGLVRLFIGNRAIAGTIPAAMAAIKAYNNDFYGFTDADHSGPADALAFGLWAQSNLKFFTITDDDDDVLIGGTETIGAVLAKNNIERAAWFYSGDANNFVDVALISRAFSFLPGSDAYSNQELAAVQATKITDGQFAKIKDFNGNTFEPVRNFNVTQNGRTASGHPIALIRGRDWLTEEMKTTVFNKFVNRRIPFTDAGILIVQQAMIETLDLAVDRGFLAPPELSRDGKRMVPSYVTQVPRASQISVSDKDAGILRGMKFSARVSGEIDNAVINGNLTYDELAEVPTFR